VSQLWTIGVLLFENQNLGLNPFSSEKPHVMKRMIQHYPVSFPLDCSLHADLIALVMELLNKDPAQRLGSEEGFSEVASHSFFS